MRRNKSKTSRHKRILAALRQIREDRGASKAEEENARRRIAELEQRSPKSRPEDRNVPRLPHHTPADPALEGGVPDDFDCKPHEEVVPAAAVRVGDIVRKGHSFGYGRVTEQTDKFTSPLYGPGVSIWIERIFQDGGRHTALWEFRPDEPVFRKIIPSLVGKYGRY